MQLTSSSLRILGIEENWLTFWVDSVARFSSSWLCSHISEQRNSRELIHSFPPQIAEKRKGNLYESMNAEGFSASESWEDFLKCTGLLPKGRFFMASLSPAGSFLAGDAANFFQRSSPCTPPSGRRCSQGDCWKMCLGTRLPPRSSSTLSSGLTFFTASPWTPWTCSSGWSPWTKNRTTSPSRSRSKPAPIWS